MYLGVAEQQGPGRVPEERTGRAGLGQELHDPDQAHTRGGHPRQGAPHEAAELQHRKAPRAASQDYRARKSSSLKGTHRMVALSPRLAFIHIWISID